MRGTLTTLAIAALFALLPATALAAPPPNDNRADAQTIPTLPATVDGTTVDSTQEQNEGVGSCANTDGSVWYRITTPNERRRVILDLTANGDMDAMVDVFRVRRSQLFNVGCGVTDDNGRLRFDFPTAGNETFLIRVAPLANSTKDTFSLRLRLAEPDATPPGPPLAKRGATGSLDRVLNPSDAYSVRLKSGKTYRFNLSSDQCTRLSLYSPDTSDFQTDGPTKTVGCRGYMIFTPDEGEGGRYSLLAQASGGATDYRLRAGPARRDDTAPGRFLRNYQKVKNSLDARRLDVVDLYRFDVTRRSDLDLRLNTDGEFTITLLSGRGHKLGIDSGGLSARLKRGRYFAVVKAARGQHASYTLRRISRTITRTHTTFDDRGRKRVLPGETVDLATHIRPDSRGRVTIRVERFDPVAGWQFFKTYKRRAASNGDAHVAFRPPAVGRWRARSVFLGSRGASPSESGFAYLKVQRPLEE